MAVLGAGAALAIAVEVTVLIGLGGRGPAARVLCPEEVINYDQAPQPAPVLTEATTLRVGEARAVGGYGNPLPTWSPHLIGDASLVGTHVSVFPTRKRCGHPLAGYRYTVLTALRPGEITVITRPAAGGGQALRIGIVA
jgi:hypothetical protein